MRLTSTIQNPASSRGRKVRTSRVYSGPNTMETPTWNQPARIPRAMARAAPPFWSAIVGKGAKPLGQRDGGLPSRQRSACPRDHHLSIPVRAPSPDDVDRASGHRGVELDDFTKRVPL